MTTEKIFKRVVRRLSALPGRVELGRTSDVGDRYVAWFPFNAGGPHQTKVYVRYLLRGDELQIDSNIADARRIR